MERTVVVLLVWICIRITYAEAFPSVADCPPYVLEGDDFNCTCIADCASGQVTVTWPGYSDTALLKQTNVTKDQNGAQFSCQMDCDGVVLTTNYTLNVYYPPTTKPVISGYTPGQIMKHGDIMSCTVTGGNPVVSAVIFYCIDPKIEDIEDEVNVTSVTSPLTVNTSLATEKEMTCSCTANWSPIFALYQLRDDMVTLTEYKATLDYFTINDKSGNVTVNESDTSVVISCAGTGRLAPTVTLTFQADQDAMALAGQETSNGRRQRILTSSIQTAKCDDMGVYTCTANNSFPDPNQASVQLNVMCSPRLLDPTNSKTNPPELTDSGLSFTVIAYLVPDNFVFTFYKDRNNETGEVVSSDMFTLNVSQVRTSSRVACDLAVKGEIPDEYVGVYGVSLSSELGGVVYNFEVIRRVKATITSFTANETSGTLTLNEKGTTVNLFCQATGRPDPTLTLTFQSDKDEMFLARVQTTDGALHNSNLGRSVSTVTCQDMGTYRCTAENGVSDPDIASLQLNVNCAPQFKSSVTVGNTQGNPAKLDDNGLTFELTAYPVPDRFHFIYTDYNETHDVPEGIFTLRATQVLNSSTVTCQLSANDVPEKYYTDVQMFSVNVSSEIGGVMYYFYLEKEAGTPEAVAEADVAAIAGGVAAAAFVIIVIIIVGVVVYYRRKRKGYSKHAFGGGEAMTGYLRSYENVLTTDESSKRTSAYNKKSQPSQDKEEQMPEKNEGKQQLQTSIKHEQLYRAEHPGLNKGDQSALTKGEQPAVTKGEQPVVNKGEQAQDIKGGQSQNQSQKNIGELPQKDDAQQQQKKTEDGKETKEQQDNREKPPNNKGQQPQENKGPQAEPNKPEQPKQEPASGKPVGYATIIGTSGVAESEPAAHPVSPGTTGSETATAGRVTVKDGAKGPAAAGPYKTTISTGPVVGKPTKGSN